MEWVGPRCSTMGAKKRSMSDMTETRKRKGMLMSMWRISEVALPDK